MTPSPSSFSLWPDSSSQGNAEANGQATLKPYPIDGTSAPVVIICPGGAYQGHCEYEGHDYALWLNSLGVSAFVLKYRLGSQGHRHEAILEDLRRAIRLVRHHAPEWNLDPGRVAVMGSSAGGHLASLALTRHDSGRFDAADPVERQSCRPDLGILCYPVISHETAHHKESRENFLGPTPSADMIRDYSSERLVQEDTPPCFLWHTAEDPGVSAEHSLLFAAALHARRIPFALHIYTSGRHGLGLGGNPEEKTLHPWTTELRLWLKEAGFLDAPHGEIAKSFSAGRPGH